MERGQELAAHGLAVNAPPVIGGGPPSRPLPIFGLDRTQPFTTSMALDRGISSDALTRMCRDSDLVRLLKGVYVVSGVPDTPDLRIAAGKLIAGPDDVVCDATAAWIWGVDVQPQGGHREVAPIRVFKPAGRGRIRAPGVSSGERSLLPDEVVDLDGVRVTSPLRTAWDLGRGVGQPAAYRRSRGLVGLDGMLRLGQFPARDLLLGGERLKGERGVVQLRELAPLADARAESPAESILRLAWLDSGLPPPEPQVPVPGPKGESVYYLDLGNRAYRVAVEYDGQEFHGSDRRTHDDRRRAWVSETHGWLIVVLVRDDLFGRGADPIAKIYAAFRRAGFGESAELLTTHHSSLESSRQKI